MQRKRILVAPLNWGLGHATRCIPVIKALMEQNFEPIIASDGDALKLLQKEFPELDHHRLPSYNIRYSKNPAFFKLKLLSQTPHILGTIAAEKKVTKQLVSSEQLDGILSDNRWGVQSSLVPSVFITHQVQVLSGFTTNLSSKIQRHYIKQFDECWVPDNDMQPHLSGCMGHPTTPAPGVALKYIGVLSRFEKEEIIEKYKIMVILSGPEPQRSLLERKLMQELKHSKATILFIRGVMTEGPHFERRKNITYCNYLTSKELQDYMNSSGLIICRPGYTSLMDLAKLDKKAFFIPTPGQYEQNYLASNLKSQKLAGGCEQHEFSLDKLSAIEDYKGLGSFAVHPGFHGLFALFQGE